MSQVKKNPLRNLLMSSNALCIFFWQIPGILPTSEAQDHGFADRSAAVAVRSAAQLQGLRAGSSAPR
jgi:hypothetical protein